jgi:hypothetical protein
MRLVAGSGRSGTTWVQDALASANGLRPVFEPLHPVVSGTGHRYAHRALGPADDCPELQGFLEAACAGRGNRLWTQYRRQRDWLFPSPRELVTLHSVARLGRRWARFVKEAPKLAVAAKKSQPIVKCIRANLMLGWLASKLGWKVVLIVRHPAAVIESELRGSWDAAFEVDRFRKDSRLHELTRDRYRGLLESRMTHLEALATRWVVENQWPVEWAPAHGVTVVHYETLKSSPAVEWQRICAALGLERPPHLEVVRRPSQQSAPRTSAAGAGVDQPRWLDALTAQQKAEISGVLERAGVEMYRMDDPRPRLPSPGQRPASDEVGVQ